MKLLIVILSALVGAASVFAGQQQSGDLVAVMEEAVNTAAHGELGRAMLQLNSQARTPKSPKEEAVETEGFQEAYRKTSEFGELDSVERLSLVFTGESFFRLRLVEKHAEGVVLWTLVGYRFKNSWYCKGVTFSSSKDLISLMQQVLDPADAAASKDEKKG